MTSANMKQLKALVELLEEYNENVGGLYSRKGYLQTSSARDLVYFEIRDYEYMGIMDSGFINEDGEREGSRA